MASNDPGSLPRDVAYAICADSCRRRLLEQLLPGERRTVDGLARDLARTAADSSDGSELAMDEHHLEILLVHSHLPYLDDHQVIDFRPEADEIVVPESMVDRFPPVLSDCLELRPSADGDRNRDDDTSPG